MDLLKRNRKLVNANYYPSQLDIQLDAAAGLPWRNDEIATYLANRGPDVKHNRRRHLWSAYLHQVETDVLDSPIILLIGGGAGTGKSTIALELAYRLGLRNVIGTDMLRETLRAVYPPDEAPLLHKATYRCWEPLAAKYDQSALVQGFEEQCRQVHLAIQAILDRVLADGEGIVIEGINLLPSLMLADYTTLPDSITFVMLQVPDHDEYYGRFEVRSHSTHLKKPQSRYTERFSQIRAIHDYLVRQAQEHALPLITNGVFDESVDQILDRVFTSVQTLVTPTGKL